MCHLRLNSCDERSLGTRHAILRRGAQLSLFFRNGERHMARFPKWCLALFVLVGLLAPSPRAHADTIRFGTVTTDNNSFPFGGGVSTPSTRYQQVYNKALFPSGPISITDIHFFHTFSAGGTFATNT